MIPEVIRTFEKCSELHKKKNADYSGISPDPMFNFNVAQMISSLFTNERDKVFATMIGIKLARIAALRNSSQKPNNESIIDSFDDMITYSAIWKADLERA